PAFDRCFIVSNQARIGRGEIDEAEVRRRFAWINERLGRPFDDWRLCPHGDDDGCACRKPLPGMFLDLAAAWSLDLAASTHVGDQDKDRDAAAAAGIGTFVWAKDFFGWCAQSSRSARWISWAHSDPSPTADATGLMLPDRTSPTANTPGRLVSKSSGLRASGQAAAARSSACRSTPVFTKPLSSSATHPFNQPVLGSAPVIRNTWRIFRV